MELFAALETMSAAYSASDSRARLGEDWAGIGFRLGMHRFLASQKEVVEVLAPPEVTRVPGAPVWVRGLANFRGQVLPLYDLGHLLMDNPTPAQSRNRYLILRGQSNPAAFLVDAVSGLRRYSRTQIQPPTVRGLPAALHPFVRGSFHDGADRRPVLSLSAIRDERLRGQV